MNSYKLNFEQFRQQPEIKEMLSALQREFPQFYIYLYLVHAVDRDVWMSGIKKIAPRYTTDDIDFAILINDKGIYEELKEYLVNTEKFTHTRIFFCINKKDKLKVDLLLFVGEEDKVTMNIIRM